MRLDINKLLVVAIISIFILAGWIFYSYEKHHEQYYDSATELLSDGLVKIALVEEMHHASRERSFLLLQMYNSNDPFERDEFHSHFSEMARVFIKARKDLITLNLSKYERDLLDHQKQLTLHIAPIQDQVADLLFEEKIEDAKKLLFNHAIPGQNDVLRNLILLSNLYSQASVQSAEKLKKDYASNRHNSKKKVLILIILGSITLIIYLLKLKYDARIKEEQNRKLELAVQEAQQANYSKSVFLANISHELRTPMHGVLSYAKLGIKKFDKISDEKKIRYFENIKMSGERLLSLLNDLLDLAKLESGRMIINFTPSCILTIVNSCIDEQRGRLEEHQQKVNVKLKNKELKVSCDAVRIGQVITNFLSNAIKFTPEGGNIDFLIETSFFELETNAKQSIKTDKSLTEVLRFSVRDYGHGIPDGELEKIFDKFVQSSNTSVATTKGTGLGLPICKEIIICHHGKVWAENHPDGGAIFTFVIPINNLPAKDCKEEG